MALGASGRPMRPGLFGIANGARHLHGGYGQPSDYGIERIARDLRDHQERERTNDIMRLNLARNLVEAP